MQQLQHSKKKNDVDPSEDWEGSGGERAIRFVRNFWREKTTKTIQ